MKRSGKRRSSSMASCLAAHEARHRARCRASRCSSRAPSARWPSVFGPARVLERREQRSASRRATPSSASSTRQSSKAEFMPWPWNGTIACAASPSSSTLAADVPGRRVHGAELPLGWVANCAREVAASAAARRGTRAPKNSLHRVAAVERREARRTGARQEQRRGEAAVGVGQRDQHEAAARPDVQRVAARARAGPPARRDGRAPCSRGRATPRGRCTQARAARLVRTAEPAPSVAIVGASAIS